jgi:hypothetical protein
MAILSGIVGVVFLLIGIVNIGWGNDPWFGVFIAVASLLYFSPIEVFIKRRVGRGVPAWGKVVLALFIVWAALGVGELAAKVDMMLSSF